MSTSERMRRFKSRCLVSRATPPSQTDVAREAIVARCADLERLCPESVDLAAQAVASLHKTINGRAADLAGTRPASVFREQLRATRPLTAEDLCRLAIQAPADLLAWLAPVLTAVSHGAPMEAAGVVSRVIAVLDERLQQTREQLAGVEALTKRVPWRTK